MIKNIIGRNKILNSFKKKYYDKIIILARQLTINRIEIRC
jgi:hypothetical protein